MSVYKIWFLAFVVCTLNGFSQQDFRISHGEIADVYRNPAMVGSESSLSVFVLHRRQWIDLPAAPVSTLIGASYRLSNKFGGAVGIQLIDDRIGNFKLNKIKFLYAKEFRFGVSILRVGAGIQGSFLNENATSWITSDTGVDNELITDGNVSNQFLDGSVGLSFKRNDIRFGLAATNVREVNLAEINWRTTRSYNSWLGYRLQWGNKIAFNSTPMIRVRMDENATPQFETRLDTEINNNYWLLTGYRINESVLAGIACAAPIAGGKMLLSYVFDYSLNELSEYNKGSHELMIRFNVNKIDVTEKKKVKNVRFL
ncbi:MAG: type IX secretion system PorP/SprF family membrane protein [Flavobacteriales bacterium]|jgi:type IX secretion system PorP/SprF family membrane protein